MLGNLNGPTLIVILFIVLLLFGAPKLPGLARSLGQSMKILKKEVSSDEKGGKDGKGADQNSADSAADTGTASGNTAAPEQAGPPNASDSSTDTSTQEQSKGGTSSA